MLLLQNALEKFGNGEIVDFAMKCFFAFGGVFFDVCGKFSRKPGCCKQGMLYEFSGGNQVDGLPPAPHRSSRQELTFASTKEPRQPRKSTEK